VKKNYGWRHFKVGSDCAGKNVQLPTNYKLGITAANSSLKPSRDCIIYLSAHSTSQAFRKLTPRQAGDGYSFRKLN
jgi:hypothetical protein